MLINFFKLIIFTEYKQLPVYGLPMTERIRKRKAFADTHLEANENIITMSSYSNHSSIANLSLSGYSMPNASAAEMLRNFVDYQLNEQQNYQPCVLYQSSYERLSPPSIMDNDNFECPPIKVQRISEINSCASNQNNCKPKLAFSIESIIGIK